ncbi:hypothetical protein L596_023751 [Steinernema carpocapsae]|uniref:Homeobox domain-containing protein n=1 Tax=Steinernema carpocapsae TaxID=34508 RepID=A0A4U5MEL8_STECR|nr:hypothetical protein L596_023751 [Steinernema carpocapsae]
MDPNALAAAFATNPDLLNQAMSQFGQLMLQQYQAVLNSTPQQSQPAALFAPFFMTPNLLNNSLPTPPSTSSSSSNNDSSPEMRTPQTKTSRKRTTYSAEQVSILENAFNANPNLCPESRNKISQLTGLNVLQVNKWFQNRRSKERKQKPEVEEKPAFEEDDSSSPEPALKKLRAQNEEEQKKPVDDDATSEKTT